MKVGDMVKWHWALDSSSWATTEFTGIIVSDRLAKTDHEKFRVFAVLINDGSMADVREDAPGLELVA